MARERKANKAQSTLNGAISNVATTVTVSDASSFPSSPQFRVLVEDELMLVTAISGSDFTVTRGIEGTSNVSHSTGLAITLIETQAGQLRHLRDWFHPMAEVSGRKPFQLLDASGSVLTASSFTDVNMTNASKTDLGDGSILMKHDTQGATNDIAIIKKSAPSAPWILTVGFIPNLLNGVNKFPSCGPVVRENSSGNFYYFQTRIQDEGLYLLATKHSSPSASATSFLTFQNWSFAGVSWYQIEDDNADLIFRFSTDGVNFLEVGREARTTYLSAPDEIGFAINNFSNGAVEAMSTLVSWDES